MSGPQILVDDKNQGAYRELVRARLIIPLHTQFGGIAKTS
jgi:hypothetical protein